LASGQASDQTNNLEGGQSNLAGGPANNPADNQATAALPSGGNAKDFSSQRSEPAASDVARLAPPPPASLTTPKAATPAAAHANASKANATKANATAAKVNAPVSADRITQLANAGNPTALTLLGLKALDSGNGIADAVKFLTQAAEKGQAVAQYRLGTLYERGQGVSADPAKAMHWYELSANQGNRKAMHNLAVAYASGPPGKRNMTEAARWFAKAAALGLSDSQFNLAVLYERGDGVPQSLVDAYKWYSIAAATGDTESQARITVLQTQLSEADKAQANRSATSFHAAPLNRAANVPPETADLGNG
jgi:localization factor PodJL